MLHLGLEATAAILLNSFEWTLPLKKKFINCAGYSVRDSTNNSQHVSADCVLGPVSHRCLLTESSPQPATVTPHFRDEDTEAWEGEDW